MKSLSLEPGQSTDEAWADRARALPDQDRARLLARADELRESGDGASIALVSARVVTNTTTAGEALPELSTAFR